MVAPVTRDVVERADVRIEVLSQGQGPLVVMIPSLGRPAEDFDDLSRRLAAAGYCALRPQPRGIGASSGPMHGITLHEFARDVAAVIEQNGGGPAVVAGHAFGNFVARTTAADFPKLVKAVVLLGATHLWPVPPDVRASINKSHAMSLPEEERIRCMKHAFFAPVHDVQPEQDVMTPPESRNRYRDELGADRVTMTVVPNAGHALLPEQPEAVAQAVLDYLKQLR